MLAAIGLGNVSKYIQQIKNTFEAFCQKSSAMHRFTKGLACCSHAKETKVQQARQQPGIGPSFTPRRPQPSPRRQARWATHVRTTWTTRWSRNGARCSGKTGGSITTGTMGCGFMFVSFSLLTCALLCPWLFAFCILLDEISLCQVYSFGIVLLELLTASPPATKREATCHWVKVVDDLRNRHVRLLTCSAVQQCLEQLLSF